MQEVNTKRAHVLKLENRNNLSLSGVKEVKNFNDDIVLLITERGAMEIRGKNLAVQKFDTYEGTAELIGEVTQIKYLNSTDKKGGMIKRLFK